MSKRFRHSQGRGMGACRLDSTRRDSERSCEGANVMSEGGNLVAALAKSVS